MKTIGIGDIHGRSIWKKIIDQEIDVDKWVFIGDYFDSRNGYSAGRQIANFKEILEFKKANMDKVILLIGNHEFHYLRGITERYSGFQQTYHIDIQFIIHEALEQNLLQICYKQDNYVFTHAGVTKTWCYENDIDITDLETSINDRFKYKPNSFKFTMGIYVDPSGDDTRQSPIWVRPNSLALDMVDDVICVVGHTSVNEILISPKIIQIDCLGFLNQYLILLDGIPIIGEYHI